MNKTKQADKRCRLFLAVLATMAILPSGANLSAQASGNFNSKQAKGSAMSVPIANIGTNQFGKLIGPVSTEDASIQKLIQENQLVLNKDAASNCLVLERGNLLLAPDKDLNIQLKNAVIHLSAGSVLLVMDSGMNVAIFDLHDKKHGDVSICTDNKSIALRPGLEALLSSDQHPDFDYDNPGAEIGFRKVRTENLDDKLTVSVSEFSIRSALKKIQPLKELLTSSDAQEQLLARQLLRNAVSLRDLDISIEPYTNTNQKLVKK